MENPNIIEPQTEPNNNIVKPPVYDPKMSVLKSLFSKFYSKKIVFWPVTGFLTIVLLIIITGTIYNSRNLAPVASNAVKVSPSPFINIGPSPTPGTDLLSVSEQKLQKLKNQIDNLDTKQGKFQPPDLDFNIQF
jgi:hypothetical protein